MIPRINTKPRRANSTKADDAKRCGKHLRWIRSLHCHLSSIACEGEIEAAHIDHEGSKGTSTKAGDWATVPLCAAHHRELHEGAQSFEALHSLDLVAVSLAFMRASPARRDLEALRSAWRATHLPRLELA